MGRRKTLADRLEELKSEDWKDRRRALKAIGLMEADAEPAIPFILRLSTDPAWKIRAWVYRSLGYIGLPRTDVIGALQLGLCDPQKAVRSDAAMALGLVGPPAASAIPLLVDALRSGSLHSLTVFSALSGMGPAAAEVAEELLDAAESDDFTVCYLATETLRQSIGYSPPLLFDDDPPPPPPDVDLLVARLEGEDTLDVERAIAALRPLGPAAAPAGPRLTELLEHPHYGIKREAAQTLGSIGDRRAVAPLMLALVDPRKSVRRLVLLALYALGGVHAPTRREFVAGLLQDPDERVRDLAADLLALPLNGQP